MVLIELLKVILLGIVEGITEWLPISSTGHMILLDEFIKLNVSAEFRELFLVVIQLGAILAVVVLYFWKLWPFHIRELERKEAKQIAEKTLPMRQRFFSAKDKINPPADSRRARDVDPLPFRKRRSTRRRNERKKNRDCIRN